MTDDILTTITSKFSEGDDQAKVCVTGANGFLGTHIVSQCLAKGYRVCATVRNAQDKRKTHHLLQLDGASTHLEIFSAEMFPDRSCGFREAFEGCCGVFHTASPGTRRPMSSEDVHTAVFGTLSVLRASKAAGVKTVVMTSGICAASPENAIVISEKDWSDPKQQVRNDNRYCASKTLAEHAAWQYMKEEPGFRLVTILPSSIVGPSLSSDLCLTNRCLLTMLKNGPPGGTCPDDSLSFVDVRDCAAHHIAAMQQETTSGRIFSTAGSWHWNDLCDIMVEINPRMLTPTKCSFTKPQVAFDLTQQNSLGVHINEMPDILRDAAENFKALGVREAAEFVPENIQDYSHMCSELQPDSSYNEFGIPMQNSNTGSSQFHRLSAGSGSQCRHISARSSIRSVSTSACSDDEEEKTSFKTTRHVSVTRTARRDSLNSSSKVPECVFDAASGSFQDGNAIWLL